jgi:hypothetical protein
MERTVARSRSQAIPLLVVILTSIVVAACGRSKGTPTTVPENARAGDLVDMKDCIFEAKDAEYKADRGTLIVPENRGDPGSRLIALPITRIRAADAMQLASAIVLVREDRRSIEYVCYDARLGDAADREGFRVIGASEP